MINLINFQRDGRAAGTRNHIVILGVTSRSGKFAKLVEDMVRAKVIS